jgi:putative aldouronate transport system substrate-binding protein
MRRTVRVLGLVLAIMAIAGFTAFGAGTKEGAAAAKLKEVKLYGYLLGAPPAGMPDVMTELNKKLKADLNATMEISYLNWADFQAKYPLVLAAGENIDWIYTANWCMYAQQAVRGAFAELTPAMLAKYMPRHYPLIPKQGWQQANVNGKIYMVPTSTPDRKVPIFLIRGDLRKKYGVPAVTKMSELEPYLAAVQKNEPGMIPINIESGYDLGFVFSNYRNQSATPLFWVAGGAVPYIWNYEQLVNPKVTTELDGDYGVAFAKAAKFVKAWYDKGYINKNPFANKVRSKEAFEQGKSAVAFGNSQDSQGTIAKGQEQGYDVEIIPALSSTGTYIADPYINNGWALAATSKNAERTLAAMDLIMEEPSYDYLVYFGVEGKNYVVKNDKIDLPEGVTADKNSYPPDASGFWFTNKDIFKPMASWPPAYVALKGGLKKMLFVTPYAAFSFVPDNVKTELANVTQVWQQYAQPIQIGMVADVDKAIAELKDKLATANSQKVLDEIQKQMDAFGAALK